MATIIKNYTIVGQSEHDESIDHSKAYWGSRAKEKMFPLPFWKARQMLSLSNSNQIALRVKDIESPDYVSANWMILEEVHVDALQDPVEKGIYYFVLNDTVFNGPIISDSGTRPGMIDAGTFHKSIIWGRLGKSTDNLGIENYYAYLLVAKCTILDEINPNGSSPACGAKIPPGGGDDQ